MSNVSDQCKRVTGRITSIDTTGMTLWREDFLLTLFFSAPPPVRCIPGDVVEACFDSCQRVMDLQILSRPLHHHDDVLRWRKPDGQGRSRMSLLRYRHRLMRRVEAWFDQEGFLQVQIPAALPAVNPEAHFDFISGEGCILSTSPELQMKRMLVGGFERIMALGPCYRGHESSSRHNPEFWMLEWYRSGATLDTILQDTESLVRECALEAPAVDSTGLLTCPDGTGVRLTGSPWPRIPAGQLIEDALGIDIGQCTDATELYSRMQQAGLAEGVQAGESFEQLFSRLWAASENNIPRGTPCFITEWPAPVASLARLDPDRPWLAERAELVIAGLELSNGFCELTDHVEQRRRFEFESTVRKQRGLPPVAPDTVFLDSLGAGMPPSAGMALGFDRLTMLLSGTDTIRDVLTFAQDEL